MIELPSLFVENLSAVVATSRLTLINRDPYPDEVGVPIDWHISLEIVDVGDDGIDQSKTFVWVDGVLAFEGGAAEEIKPAFAGNQSATIQSPDALRIVLDPIVPLQSLSHITVRVASALNNDIATLDETYSFQIEDRTTPQLLSAQAIGQKRVRLAFDEPIKVTPNSVFTFKALETPATPIEAVGTEIEGSVLVVHLNTEMTPRIPYDVHVAGIVDVFDNEILPPFDRYVFAGFQPPVPLDRRFDLWSMLPRHNRRDDHTGDLWRFIACLQEVVDLLLHDIDCWPNIFNIERAPQPFLDLILTDLGNPFDFDLDELQKRRLAAILVRLYKQKGTAIGIINAIRFFLGVEVEILPFAADTLVLGESELGVDWILGPSDRAALYSFNVEASRYLSEAERYQIRTIVEYLKPAHTHFRELMAPEDPESIDHWELGVSELGINTFPHEGSIIAGHEMWELGVDELGVSTILN